MLFKVGDLVRSKLTSHIFQVIEVDDKYINIVVEKQAWCNQNHFSLIERDGIKTGEYVTCNYRGYIGEYVVLGFELDITQYKARVKSCHTKNEYLFTTNYLKPIKKNEKKEQQTMMQFKVGDMVKCKLTSLVYNVIDVDLMNNMILLGYFAGPKWKDYRNFEMYKEAAPNKVERKKKYQMFHVANLSPNEAAQLSKVASLNGWKDTCKCYKNEETFYLYNNILFFRNDNEVDYGGSVCSLLKESIEKSYNEVLDILLGIKKRPIQEEEIEITVGDTDVIIKPNKSIKFGCTTLNSDKIEEIYKLYKQG